MATSSEDIKNSKEVVEFAQRLKKLHDEVQSGERAERRERSNNSESVMGIDRGVATDVFYNRIVPHLRKRFWEYVPGGSSASVIQDAPLTPSTNFWTPIIPLGANEERCVMAIFAEIKGMILDAIIKDTVEDVVIRDWVRANKAALTNPAHGDHTRVIRASREQRVTLSNGTPVVGYLTSIASAQQTAWRNFDPDAPHNSAWPNLFVGNKIGDMRDPEVQRRLAYYYLVATDVTQSPETLEFRRGNFIALLAEIRRAHNEGRTVFAMDDPSCLPGTFGRMALMGREHPIAQLTTEVSELLPRILSSVIQNHLTKAFSECRDLQSKIRLRDALCNLHSGNADQVISNADQYETELFPIRRRFIESLGSADEVCATINAELRRQPGGRDLTLDARAKVSLAMMDPYSYWGQNIRDTLMRSLDEKERAELVKLDVPDTIPEFEKLMKTENEIARNGRTRAGAGFRYFDEVAMRRRVIRALAERGCEDGNIERIEAVVTAHEEEELVKEYNNAVSRRKKEFGEHDKRVHEYAILDVIAKNRPDIVSMAAKRAEVERVSQQLQSAQDKILLREVEGFLNVMRRNPALSTWSDGKCLARFINNKAQEHSATDELPDQDKVFDALQNSLCQQVITAMQRRRKFGSIDYEGLLELISLEAVDPIGKPGPITYRQLGLLVHELTSISSGEIIKDAVYFPNHPNQGEAILFYSKAEISKQCNRHVANLGITRDAEKTFVCEHTGVKLKQGDMRSVELFARVALVAASQVIQAYPTVLTKRDLAQGVEIGGEDIKDLEEAVTQIQEANDPRIQEALSCIYAGKDYRFVEKNKESKDEAENKKLEDEVEAENKRLMERLRNAWGIKGRRVSACPEFLKRVVLAALKETIDLDSISRDKKASRDRKVDAELTSRVRQLRGLEDHQASKLPLAEQLEIHCALDRIYAGKSYRFVEDEVENKKLMDKLRACGIGAGRELSERAGLRAVPQALLPIIGNAIPRGYNSAVFEPKVLAEGTTVVPLDYSQPGQLPLLILGGQIQGGTDHHRLTSPEIGLAGPYQGPLAVPQVPVIHPYNPTGNSRNSARTDLGIARFSLTARLPGGTLSNLPPGAAEYLVHYDVDFRNVETFVSFQNKPWQHDALEFRPHPWLHQDAPESGAYDRTSRLSVAFADLDSRFGLLSDVEAQTHNEGALSQVVFSPDNMQIAGLGDHNVTEGFYSFCLDRDTGRVAITLHCLLNDAHQKTLEDIAAAGFRRGVTLESAHAQMVGELPVSITNALSEFMGQSQRVRAASDLLPRRHLREAVAVSPGSSVGVVPGPSGAIPQGGASLSAGSSAPSSVGAPRPSPVVTFSAASRPSADPSASPLAQAAAPVAASAPGVPRPAAPPVPQAGVPAPAPSAASSAARAPEPVAAPIVAPPPQAPAPTSSARATARRLGR